MPLLSRIVYELLHQNLGIMSNEHNNYTQETILVGGCLTTHHPLFYFLANIVVHHTMFIQKEGPLNNSPHVFLYAMRMFHP